MFILVVISFENDPRPSLSDNIRNKETIKYANIYSNLEKVKTYTDEHLMN